MSLFLMSSYICVFHLLWFLMILFILNIAFCFAFIISQPSAYRSVKFEYTRRGGEVGHICHNYRCTLNVFVYVAPAHRPIVLE